MIAQKIAPPPLPLKVNQRSISSPPTGEMESALEYSLVDSTNPGTGWTTNASVAVTGSKTEETNIGCSSHSSSTVFVAAPSGGIAAAEAAETVPLTTTVLPAPRNGHVVTIRINPDNVNTVEGPRQKLNTKVSLNQSEPINTIGKFIVNICENSDVSNKQNGVTISVKSEQKMVQKSETILKSNEMGSPYFFCNTLMSSGQCSPSDTLDSGTCSDLDGTPPPLPKKKSSKINGSTHKRISVTVIGGTTHDRASSVASSGAEVDSEDSESNISCDSLNSSDLSSTSIHEDAVVAAFKPQIQLKDSIPKAPKMPTLLDSGKSSGLPQGLLQDIRDRSAKLTSFPNEEEMKTSWADLEKKVEVSVVNEVKSDDKLTSFKLVSQASSDNKRKEISTVPIIVDATPAHHKSTIVNESTYEDRKIYQEKLKQDKLYTCNFSYDTDKYYNFHLNENVFENDIKDNVKSNKRNSVVSLGSGVVNNGSSDSDFFEDDNGEYFAGFKDYRNEDTPSTIRSAKGTIRGVKNRVRAGIATFLQMQNTTAKSYREKDAGKVVVYTTSMGIVRGTYQKCVQVKKILRTLLVKFEERDVFMSGECQEEIKDRMKSSDVLVPQIFVDGQHVGDAETVERLNECGELRRMLKPYKSADACTTCQVCGGYRLLPCPVCSGSKKSVHRNHFTAEFVALKCMNCDEVGLVKCEAC
ncbi:glutaredoxin domain-containing cysteine-rich protein CG31559 [Arctopsyche grandis]|uniref:glutaredoxin domain-containing cysteine-rich protein CG31559 n=1 Tax=Arctopsyche grandis TaxID=121162 RepID=UPI00406D98B2